jgi:AcrR family transcriptional regulator
MTSQKALERAMEVFMARGYDGATLEDLQAAMGGITPPSFYAAFGSKDGLFREAVALYCETIGSRPQQALQAATARQAIADMLRATADIVSTPDGPRGCLLVLAAMNCTRANKEVHDELRAIRQRAPQMIRARLARAVDEGELPAGLDLTGMASFYATVVHGLAIRARDGASRAEIAAAVDGAMLAWTGLLKTRAPAAHRRSASSHPRSRTRR